MKSPETIIFAAFTIANVCRLLAYLPQISILVRQSNATAVSSATWSLFTVSNAITAIYAVQIIADTAMAVTFTANTICCATIVALVHCKRRKVRRSDFDCAGSAKVQERSR